MAKNFVKLITDTEILMQEVNTQKLNIKKYPKIHIQTYHIETLENLRIRRKILKEDKGRQNILPLMEQGYKLQWTIHQNP